MTDDIISLNESQSQIENKDESIDSESSMRSLNSFIEELGKNKAPNDPSSVLKNSHFKAHIPRLPLQSSISRNILTHNVLRNPYISPTIKMKMNAIIADSNMSQTTFNRYQLYSNTRCLMRKTSIEITHSARLSDHKHYSKKEFTFTPSGSVSASAFGSCSTAISTSMQKINEIKQHIESNTNSCRGNINTPSHFINGFRQSNGIIVSLRKKYNEKNTKCNSNHNSNYLNPLMIPHNRKSTFSNKISCSHIKNSLQLLDYHPHQRKLTSRLLM